MEMLAQLNLKAYAEKIAEAAGSKAVLDLKFNNEYLINDVTEQQLLDIGFKYQGLSQGDIVPIYSLNNLQACFNDMVLHVYEVTSLFTEISTPTAGSIYFEEVHPFWFVTGVELRNLNLTSDGIITYTAFNGYQSHLGARNSWMTIVGENSMGQPVEVTLTDIEIMGDLDPNEESDMYTYDAKEYGFDPEIWKTLSHIVINTRGAE